MLTVPVLKVSGLTVKWIYMQHIFILYDYISEDIALYSLSNSSTTIKERSKTNKYQNVYQSIYLFICIVCKTVVQIMPIILRHVER